MPRKNAPADSPRAQIMRLEKKLYAENKAAIKEATVVEDPNFKAYWRHYQGAIRRYARVSDMGRVLDAVDRARVVLVGDYHTLDQSQRSFVRLLRGYFDRDKRKKAAIAIETVQARFQKHLTGFMEGGLGADDFIKKIGFRKHWFFDLWRNYRVIFDYLLYHRVPLRAIDADNRKKHTLLDRDVFMAREIVKFAKERPADKIFVLVGDLHLAPRHLPGELKKLARREKLELPLLTLYQNSPEIHWDLSRRGNVDHIDVVQVSETEFCRQHTPPLIVQQSYLNWLYHEDDSFDWIDAKGSFVHLVEQVAGIVGLDLPKDFENVDVYTCGDLSFLKTLKRRKIFTKKELDFIRGQVVHSESYFMPRSRMVYIANVSIHHAAEEATHYLKYLFSGEEFPRSRQDAFYANALHEAIGFFGSKLVNAKRKCPRLGDFVKDAAFLMAAPAATHDRQIRLETADLFIQHAQGLKKFQLIHPNKVKEMSSRLFLSVTHAVGYDLGDHLYYGFMAGAVPKEIIKDLFMERFEDEGEPGKMYIALQRLLKSIKRPPKV
jgi:uncharacterized iron-regulated protein